MEDERIQALRRGIETFNRGDWDGLLAHSHPDVSLRRPSGLADISGREAVRKFLQPDVFEQQRYEAKEFIAGEDAVVIHLVFHAKARGSGIELSEGSYVVFRFRGDLVSRIEPYDDRGEALTAAGIADHRFKSRRETG